MTAGGAVEIQSTLAHPRSTAAHRTTGAGSSRRRPEHAAGLPAAVGASAPPRLPRRAASPRRRRRGAAGSSAADPPVFRSPPRRSAARSAGNSTRPVAADLRDTRPRPHDVRADQPRHGLHERLRDQPTTTARRAPRQHHRLRRAAPWDRPATGSATPPVRDQRHLQHRRRRPAARDHRLGTPPAPGPPAGDRGSGTTGSGHRGLSAVPAPRPAPAPARAARSGTGTGCRQRTRRHGRRRHPSGRSRRDGIVAAVGAAAASATCTQRGSTRQLTHEARRGGRAAASACQPDRALPREARPRGAATSVAGRRSGLYTIVAVHSTVRGPSLGGCRMWSYDDARAAVRDALRLSRAMTLKAAVADLASAGARE